MSSKRTGTRMHAATIRGRASARRGLGRGAANPGAATTPPSGSLGATVRDLNRRFRLGLFDQSLFAAAEAALQATENVPIGHDYVTLKCRCVVAEIFEVQGRRERAVAAVKEGEAVAALLDAPFDQRHRDSLQLMRERARFVADFARIHLYRRGKFHDAKDRLEVCARFLEEKVRRPTFRCHGTMGLIKYYTGCAERQLGRLEEADVRYVEAIGEYRARGERALHEDVSPERLQEELAMARHNTAVILGLGLGWTNSQRGLLTKALTNNIMPAEILLMGAQDQTHKAYLALIRGSILRSLAGSSNANMLEEAKTSIQAACEAFTRPPYQQQAYALRGWYELALCATIERDFNGARTWIAKTEEAAKALDDLRWQATSWMIKSRINRNAGNVEGAAMEAEVAVKMSSGMEEAVGLIDAYVTRAEAFIALGRSAAARDDLNRALHIVEEQRRPNQKIQSVVHILLAKTSLLDGDTHIAQQEFDVWSRRKEAVEHVLVHEMAEPVRRRLDALKHDFTIPWRTETLQHDAHDRRLRAWLMRRVRHEHGAKTKAEIAELLGIARPTLNAWEAELQHELANGDVASSDASSRIEQ